MVQFMAVDAKYPRQTAHQQILGNIAKRETRLQVMRNGGLHIFALRMPDLGTTPG